MAGVLEVSYSDMGVEMTIGLSSSVACHLSMQDRLSFRLLSKGIADGKFAFFKCMEEDPSGRAV